MKKAPVKLKTLRFPVHQAIYQLNRSFEECIGNLHQVMHFRYFDGDTLHTYLLMLKEVRALTNHELAGVMGERESENAAYFERLRLQWLERLEKQSVANASKEAGKARGRPKKTPPGAKNNENKKVRP